MELNLFGSKKDHAEIKDAQDIKAATTQNNNNNMNSGNAPAFNPNLDSTVNQNQTDFVNPFANDTSSNLEQSPFDLHEEIIQSQEQTNIGQNPISTTQINQPSTESNFQETLKESDTYSKDQIQEIIDETVEKVIEERWTQLVDKVNKVAAWKEKQDAHIEMIKEDIVAIRDGVEKLEKRLLSKVESYDKNILDVNSEIKALEKVFQKITPTLVNNVNELTKITQGFRDERKNSESKELSE